MGYGKFHQKYFVTIDYLSIPIYLQFYRFNFSCLVIMFLRFTKTGHNKKLKVNFDEAKTLI